MVLNRMAYFIITTILVLFHLPLFFMFNHLIEFSGKHYPIPVILIVLHTWLWLESRTKYVNVKTKFHLYGILTGFLSFFSVIGLHILPNLFAVVSGLILVGKFATKDFKRYELKPKEDSKFWLAISKFRNKGNDKDKERLRNDAEDKDDLILGEGIDGSDFIDLDLEDDFELEEDYIDLEPDDSESENENSRGLNKGKNKGTLGKFKEAYKVFRG